MRIIILLFAIVITINAQPEIKSSTIKDSVKNVPSIKSITTDTIMTNTLKSLTKNLPDDIQPDSEKSFSKPLNNIVKQDSVKSKLKTANGNKKEIANNKNIRDTANKNVIKDSAKSNIKSLPKYANNNSSQSIKKDSAKTTFETVSQIIPDGEVKQKLSDIFSISKIIWALIFLIISFYIIKLITKILDKFSEKSTRYRIGLKGIIPIFRITAWTIVISIVIAVIFAPPIESLVVVTGSLGIAIGLASQDIIKNIFGGIITLFDRPFQVGDKVEIGSYYGEVKSIGLRSTRIVTPDDSVISIPNGDIMTKSVSNANTGEANCQVVAEIYLPPHIDLQKAREIGIKAAQVSKYIYLNKPIVVIFKNEIHFNKSVIKMRLKAYVLDIRYEFKFMSDMTEITIRELLKHGIVTKDELNGISA